MELREDGKRCYEIKWKGYSEVENSWEPEENIPEKLRDGYAKKNKKQIKNQNS